jgi:hypothetical protein
MMVPEQGLFMTFDSPYKTEFLQPAFEEFVLGPFRSHEHTAGWENEVLNKLPDYSYHSNVILKHGQADFRIGHNDLTPSDKVLLYCYYYMQMHAISGFHVFDIVQRWVKRANRCLISDGLFIVIGCGPLTAGLSLAWCYATLPAVERRTNRPLVSYIGIDNAPEMLQKASEIAAKSNLFDSKSLFHFAPSFTDVADVGLIISHVQHRLSEKPHFVVFNLSYAIASSSVEIKELFDFMRQVTSSFPSIPVLMLVQNPQDHPSIEKWREVKRALSSFRVAMNNRETIWFSDSVSKSRPDSFRIRLHYEMLVKA